MPAASAARQRRAPADAGDAPASSPSTARREQNQHDQQQQGKQGRQQRRQFDIDEGRPLVFQVGRLGANYWRWLDMPVAGRARFFESAWAEALSQTPWWVVPLLWAPAIAATSAAALRALAAERAAGAGAGASSGGAWAAPHHAHQPARAAGSAAGSAAAAGAAAGAAGAIPPLAPAAPQLLALHAAGAALWQLLEYAIHRFAFHADAGTSYWAVTLHFLFHGNHHKYPSDRLRLVFPPLPAALIAALIYGALRGLLARPPALAVMAGVMAGYVAYDCTHYLLHHGGSKLPGSYLKGLKLRHAHHHFQDHGKGYQISSPLFDVVFGTRADVSTGGGKSKAGGGKARA